MVHYIWGNVGQDNERRQHGTANDGDPRGGGPYIVASQDEAPAVETSEPSPSETVLRTPVSTDTGDTIPSAQEQLEYDLDRELETLRTKVHEMMTETVLLTDLVDQKDAALRDAKRRLDSLQVENAKLKQIVSLPSTTKPHNVSSQESRTAKQLEIAALQAELEVEKLRRQELEEQILAKGGRKEAKDNNDDHDDSSVSISDVEDEDSKGDTPPQEESESNSITKTRVFGQEGKFYTDQPQTTNKPPLHYATIRQYTDEIGHLQHLIRKRDEGIEILRDKLVEQESLISLLNKTLSTKDTKLDRLERLVRGSQKWQARRVAARLLGMSDELRVVPALIFALSDPDRSVRRYARDGLRFISRKFDGYGMPDDPTNPQLMSAQRKWREWYRTMHPGYVFIDEDF